MATATPTWDSCRVHGRWVSQGGALLPGRYRVRVPVRITNAAGDVIVPAGEFASGNLITSNGASKSFDMQVPASEDPDNFPPGDWKIIIDITFDDRNLVPEQYIISTPVNGDINLRTIILPTQVPDYADLAIKGVPGGLAELDPEGYVVNADGTRPSGTGGDGGSGGPGTPGREVELQANNGFIQWRYVGTIDWIDLVALSEIGPGAELRKTATHIQYRTIGTTTWNDLVPLADIKGDSAITAGYIMGDMPTRFATSATALPPRASVVPNGYTGPVRSDTVAYPGHPGPSDAVDGDRWRRRTVSA